MNKEMVEIMELKGELQELKTSTEEQITSITKRIKDNKNENRKLIETKFEEIMDTVNFSVNNNPNISKKEDIDYGDTAGLEDIVDKKLEGAIDKQVGSIVDEKISDYEKGREEDIGELTSVVEEIADRLVEENKGIKKRIKELENGYMTISNGVSNGGSNSDTEKIVKQLEQNVNEGLEKNNGQIEELKQQGEANLGKIEGLEKQVETLLGKIENQDGNEELVEQISILDKKYQGGKLEINEEIKTLRQQVEILKEKIVGENEIMNLIEQASGNGTEEISKTVGDIQGVQNIQGENIKELEKSLQTQNEKIETIIALTKEQEQAVKQLEETAVNKNENKELKSLKDRFTELRDSQQTQEKKLSQIEGLQIYQNEKLKEIDENGTKLSEIQEKIENLENNQTIKGEELVELKGKNDKQDEKIETLIQLAQETEKELNNCREKIDQFEGTINEADEKIKNANISKDEILGELNGVYGKQIDNFEDRVNLLEKNQNDQETKLEGYQTQIIGKVEEQLGTVKDGIDAKLEAVQGKIEGKLGDYKTKQDESLNRIGKIENSLKKIGEKNQNFAVSLNYLNKNIEQYKDENEKKANETQIKITDLEQKITNLQEEFGGNTEKLEGELGGLQGKLGVLQEIAEEQKGQNEKNVTAIEGIEQKVTGLQENQTLQNEQLTAQIEALGVKLDEIKENAKSELEEKITEVQTANNTELDGIKEKIAEVQKIDKIIKDQEENSRKVKNLAIAMEERLEVYEGNFKSTIEEEISKTGVKQSIDEINEKLTSQGETVDSLNGGIEQLEGKIKELNETISEKLQQQAEDNYSKLQAENEVILDNKIKSMQAKSNKIFTKQLNQMQAENQSIISDQIDGINGQISATVAKELERMKIENTRMMNEKIARMQIQAEAELDKKVKKIQAEYEKKIKIMEQMINNLIQDNSKNARAGKRTSGNNTTQVFAYEPIEDINNYKNLYKKVQNNKVKNVAKNFTEDLDDMDIINFFDEDQED